MKNKYASIAIGIVALACVLINLSLKNWNKQDRVIEWDVHSYYSYLPAYFIYHDIKLEKSDYLFDEDYYLFWPVITKDGKKVDKMTMGTAILYSPFFFIAHAYTSVTDYPEDGFSVPYKVFLLLSTIFYLIIGLDFVRKILSIYNFSDTITAIVILLLGLGTNLLCYASESAPMSHVYSFCMFALFIYYTIKWHEKQSIKHTLIVGLLFGLISLIRPTNAVLILFFILYDVSGFKQIGQKIVFFFKNYFHILLMAMCTLLVWVPQFLYWKTLTGHYLFYSYIDEGFFFKHPHILEGLFSWRKGWLLYTPMMVFALIGICLLKGELKKFRVPIIVFMIFNVYIIFSWWCWWYGGTYGQRSLIESYAMLAIPFASFISFLWQKKWYYNIPFYLLAVFLIWLNIFQTYQFEFHSLHYDGMTKELYFKQFGKLSPVPGYDNMASPPNYDAAKKGEDYKRPSNGNTSPAHPAYNRTPIATKTIQLKACNGKYVCADLSLPKQLVVANRDTAQGWETFTLLQFEKNECAINAVNNMFLCAELNLDGEVTASRVNIGNWETFTMVQVDSTHVAFKAVSGKYLSLDEKNFRLFARGSSVGRNEIFSLIIK